jgi:flagellar FliL protein
MATSPKAAAAKPEDPAAPKASNKKMIIGGAVGLIVAIAAGGGGWYFAKGKESHDAAPHVEEVKPVHVKPAIFVPLEPYTVNLKRETSDQYLQIGISLKVYEAPIELQIKENQPEIRSKILQLLTTKTATELLTQEGKTKLAKEIATLGNAVIGIVPPPVVYAPPPQPLAAPVAADPHAPAAVPPAVDPHAPVAAVTPVAPQPQPVHVEPKGIIDVLFTSFIIQ